MPMASGTIQIVRVRREGRHRESRILERWKSAARRLKLEVQALILGSRDPRVPLCARFIAVLVVADALSPIDLIPDFIPILGYADDLILIPLGVLLVTRLIPAAVLEEYRNRARTAGTSRPRSGSVAALLILALWASVLGFTIRWMAAILLPV